MGHILAALLGAAVAICLFCSCSPVGGGGNGPETPGGGRRVDGQGGARMPPIEPMHGREKAWDIEGRLGKITLLSDHEGPWVKVDLDPRFAVAVTEVRVNSGSLPCDHGIVVLGVHSASKLFGPSQVVGQTWRFTAWRSERTGTLWLEAEPALPGPETGAH